MRLWIRHPRRWLAAVALWLAAGPAAAGGPVPPELASFSALDQQDLVDPFTGDFRYSVSLMEVPGPNGGYPLQLSYASGITTDQDASWVGLGFTFSPGSIVRQMRGIPDDFAGDEVVTARDIEPNVSYGLGIEGNYEIFGADSSVGTGLTAGLTGYFDNYRGFGITHTVGLSGQTKNQGTAASVGLNLSEDTLEGAKVAATASLSLGDSMRFGADTAFDASRGLSALSLSAEAKYQSASYLVSSGNLLTYLGYAKPAALPGTQREMLGSNIKISFKMGGEVYGNYISGKMLGYYNYEALKSNATRTKAFGFLHLEGAGPDDALDFNRERDGALHEQSPNLAMPVLTHDLFVISGRDVVGTFRAYRNDAPVVFDPLQRSEITGGAVGVDVGFGNVIKVGVAGALNRTATQIGRWEQGGAAELIDKLQSGFPDDPSGRRERTYFKLIGEPSAGRSSIVSGSSAPLGVSLKEVFDGTQVPPQFFRADADSVPLTPVGERVPRATLIQAFTNGELREMGNALPEFKRDFAPLAGETQRRRDHHIGGFRVTAVDGTRHVYGIAVYNVSYQEQKFSVDRRPCGTGPCAIVTPPGRTPQDVAGSIYDYQADGSEKLLEAKSLPAYPTSYLLTAILGPDYIDADGVPGPSDGDHGYWVRFNYVREQNAQGAAQLFPWRIPFVGASFVRGPDNGRYVTGTQRRGDKGYVTYGERESWYLTSVETATHKAFMCIERGTRVDAIGAVAPAQNSTPVTGFARPGKLTAVKLFAKNTLGGAATGCPSGNPLVQAHLEYDNSLAKGAPNAPGGKLTLRKVYFTHQDNVRGRLSPYRFDYGSTAAGAASPSNPRNEEGASDRWNRYRDPAIACGTAPPTAAPPPAPALVDDDVPTCQEGDRADQWSSAWTLRKIEEPSGRLVQVDYEADDYAYVQDQPAMRLFRIVSVNGSAPAAPSDVCPLWSGPFNATCGTTLNKAGTGPQRARVYFRLERPFTANDPRCSGTGGCDAWIKQHYLGDARQLYFRTRVALRPNDRWQTVSGYANATGAGSAAGTTDVGWIELAPVHSNYPPPGFDYNPLAHAAWQYLRLEQPELIRNGGLNGDPAGDPIEEALRVLTLVDAIPDIVAMFSGVYPRWATDGFGSKIDLAHSWVRLQDPDGVKKGGGTRVRRIRASDRWSASTAAKEEDLETGFLYSYRLEDGRSSGVASYEPMVGGEENPLRRAKPFTDQVLLSSNYNLFAELPIGESHYPAPAVGYSRVVRRTLAAQADVDARVAAHDCQNPGQNSRPRATSTGPTIFEFYTARDFPVRVAETALEKRRPPLPQIVLIPLLGEITMNSVTASQGYSTIVNDMHGKQRRVASYEYTDKLDCARASGPDYVMREEPVTETVYNYRSAGGFGASPATLDNADVATLVEDPTTRLETMGEQTDFVVDLRHNRTESFDGGINLNVDTFLVAFYPLPIPVPMPNFGYSLSETRTVVTSRLVHRAGILDSVNVRQGSARLTTRNERYDPLTGDALLRSSDNAYGDPVYEYALPARWTYARMGAGYEDVGRVIDLTGSTLDVANARLAVMAPIALCAERPPQQTPDCLSLGTELATRSPAGGARLTLLGTDIAGATLFAVEGALATVPASAVVVRSGNRNVLSPRTDTIRALRNPLDPRDGKTCIAEGATVTQAKAHGVLDAAHTTYRDQWPSIANEVPARSGARDEFARGVRGIFRPAKEYAYLMDRAQSRPIDLRRDGTFDLVMFGQADDPATCEPGWVRRLTRTKYAASGFATEDLDALSIPSAALYGAGGKLMLASASNAGRDEIGYEGFETDRTARVKTLAGEGNFTYGEDAVTFVTTDFAHTGRRSLRVVWDSTFEQSRLMLVPGKRYLLSGWIGRGSAESAPADVVTYARSAGSASPVGLRVSFKPAGSTAPTALATFVPEGPIIDGWQRIEGTFEAPPGGERIAVHLLAGNGAAGRGARSPALFDDLRMLPESASLESYVYDPDTLRMTARLDENNYATFYRYTADGKVDLIRRETVNGILAQQEGRVHLKEQP